MNQIKKFYNLIKQIKKDLKIMVPIKEHIMKQQKQFIEMMSKYEDTNVKEYLDNDPR